MDLWDKGTGTLSRYKEVQGRGTCPHVPKKEVVLLLGPPLGSGTELPSN